MKNRAAASFLATGALLLATLTAGCSTGEPPAGPTAGPPAGPPAVCTAVDSLKTSVTTVTTVDLSQGALTELQDNLTQVKSDVAKLKVDAKDEFATQIDAVEQASASVGSSIDAAKTSPSVQAITHVGTSVRALGTSLRGLEDAVGSTC